MNIILIGYRCSGKTSVGKNLAQKLGWPFVDTDDRLKEKYGRPVSGLVEDEGWEGFRRLERDVIREVCSEDSCVIASGGGAVLDPENVAAMRKSGRVVWLKVSPQTVKQRMAEDENTDEIRPALTSKGLYAEIIDVLQARTPIYEQAKDVSIDTDGNNIMEIVDLIMQEIESEKNADDDT